MAEAQRKVPLVRSAPVSEFGEFPDEGSTAYGLDRDGTYVPGFSEMRVDRDTKYAQYLRGEIARGQVPTLPVNLRWARNQNKAGNPDNSKPFSHSRRGYKYVTKADVGQDWFKELPGGAQWDAAGNLRNGDTVLMVATAKDAARNETNRRRETDARMTGVTNAFTQNLAQAGVRETKGADPTIERMADGAKLFSGEKK